MGTRRSVHESWNMEKFMHAFCRGSKSARVVLADTRLAMTSEEATSTNTKGQYEYQCTVCENPSNVIYLNTVARVVLNVKHDMHFPCQDQACSSTAMTSSTTSDRKARQYTSRQFHHIADPRDKNMNAARRAMTRGLRGSPTARRFHASSPALVKVGDAIPGTTPTQTNPNLHITRSGY